MRGCAYGYHFYYNNHTIINIALLDSFIIGVNRPMQYVFIQSIP